MTSVHYLAGPCEGMSLHRNGKMLTLKDTSGRESEQSYNCDNDDHARESERRWREILYAKYSEGVTA